MTDKFNLVFLILAASLFCFGITPDTCLAQDDESKGVTSDAYTNERPVKKAQRTSSSAKKMRYKLIASTAEKSGSGKLAVKKGDKPPQQIKTGINKNSSETISSGSSNDNVIGKVGLTLWRHVQAKGENGTKGLGTGQATATGKQNFKDEWERLESSSLLKPGEQIRISIESLSHKGYLYIIDREQYTDGTFGEPKLIFPTADMASNYVIPGRVASIPPVSNDPFTIEIWGKDKTLKADLLTIIVSPTMLMDQSQLEPQPRTLTPAEVALLEKNWTIETRKLELIGGAGQLITEVEQEAAKGLGTGAGLAQDDPPPQTVYEINVKPGKPIMIKVPLNYKLN
jgi:hypothetical protein